MNIFVLEYTESFCCIYTTKTLVITTALSFDVINAVLLENQKIADDWRELCEKVHTLGTPMFKTLPGLITFEYDNYYNECPRLLTVEQWIQENAVEVTSSAII